MAKKTREQLKAASDSTYTTNGAKAITAEKVRNLNNDWLDSMVSAYESAQAGGYTGTEAEFNALLAKAGMVAQNMIIKLNGGSVEGTSQFTFNGSAAKSVNITPSSIGAPTTSELNNKVDKNETDRLMTAAEGTKLNGIATGAQVNVIEGVQLNGVDLPVTDKKVNIITSGGGGEPGTPGADGEDGKSAYQSAKDGGFTGTELEFNTSLASIGDINAVLDAINGEVI